VEFISEHFGVLRYQPDQVITFPEGLPAFEDEREFLLIERPSTAPVVFLQSLRRPGLAFITLPAGFVEPPFQLEAAPEDLQALDLPAGTLPVPGPQLLCLAIVTVADGKSPTANLMAPVVINLRNRLARQIIVCGSPYSHQHPLVLPSGEALCS
jgi:flagellar assembly factor FliW